MIHRSIDRLSEPEEGSSAELMIHMAARLDEQERRIKELEETVAALQENGTKEATFDELKAEAAEQWPEFPNIIVTAYTPATKHAPLKRKQYTSLYKAARELGVNPMTLLTWLLKPEQQPYFSRNKQFHALHNKKLAVKKQNWEWVDES